MAAKGNIYDQARALSGRSRREIEDMERGETASGRVHPVAASVHRKPKASSMAPREGNKRKHYGRAFNEGR